jgi:hypothetical protein
VTFLGTGLGEAHGRGLRADGGSDERVTGAQHALAHQPVVERESEGRKYGPESVGAWKDVVPDPPVKDDWAHKRDCWSDVFGHLRPFYPAHEIVTAYPEGIAPHGTQGVEGSLAEDGDGALRICLAQLRAGRVFWCRKPFLRRFWGRRLAGKHLAGGCQLAHDLLDDVLIASP